MRVELGNRELVLLVLVLLLGSFVFAYVFDDSGNPAVMGHSAGELEINASDINVSVGAYVVSIQRIYDSGYFYVLNHG